MRLYLTALLLCVWWCIEHWQLSSVTWVGEWLTYMNRLAKEAQGLFVNGVRAPTVQPPRLRSAEQEVPRLVFG
jgi:hypothetical protein